MAHIKLEWVEHQRRRWMRPDAHRWIRPDAHRWLRPDYKRFLQPDADPWPLLALFEGKANFNPSQPRVLAGNLGAGRWTDQIGWSDGGNSLFEQTDGGVQYEEPILLAQLDGILDDAGKPYYSPGGHHELSKEVYKPWKNLSDDVRRIFDKATTGTVPKDTIRFSPDGEPRGHFWKGRNSPHGIYNEAVKDLSEKFFQKNGIDRYGGNMTAQHAHELLKEIRESDDPRIRNHNNMIRLLRRLIPLRSGRGTE